MVNQYQSYKKSIIKLSSSPQLVIATTIVKNSQKYKHLPFCILGMSKDELKSELKSGKSLEEIAKSKGISKEELVGKIKVELTPWITKMVEYKHSEKMD